MTTATVRNTMAAATLLEGTWLTSLETARRLGVSLPALCTRRYREGIDHPRTVSVGNAVLYYEPDVSRYAIEWVDGRRKA